MKSVLKYFNSTNMAEKSNTQEQMRKTDYIKQLFLLRKTTLKEVKLYTTLPPNPNHSKNSPPTHEHCLLFNLQISLKKSVSTVGTTLKESSKDFCKGKTLSEVRNIL